MLVFVRKPDQTVNFVRPKARLVVKGYMQGDLDQNLAPFLYSRTVMT